MGKAINSYYEEHHLEVCFHRYINIILMNRMNMRGTMKVKKGLLWMIIRKYGYYMRYES